MGRRPWLALLPLLLGGCHILFPYTAGGRSDGDAAGDRRVGDGPRGERRQELGPPGDLPRSEAGCPIAKLEDRLALCSDGCADKNNPDCDGLPALGPSGRDFFPACNKLLFEDHFTSPPTSASWFDPSTTYQGTWSWTCGWYHQTATGGTYPDPMQMAWARSTAAEPLVKGSADYLVEARVQLGAIGNSNIWGVGIVARYSTTNPFANIVCELRVDKVNGGNPGGPLIGTPAVTNPDVRLETRVSAQEWSPGWPISRDSKAVGDAGKVYYLQLWYTNHYNVDPLFSSQCVPTDTCKAIVCRVCEEEQCVRDGTYEFWINGDPTKPDTTLLPTAPGSVGLRTYGRAASFDYIRVYQLTDP